MKKCPKCQNLHSKNGTFCSRACANSRGSMSKKDKEFRRQWAKANPRGAVLNRPKNSGRQKDPSRHKITTCPTCNIEFKTYISNPRTFCQPSCVRLGGLRKGSGNKGKSGYFKGFYLRSTYELAYVIYCHDHNISIKPYDGYFEYYDSKKNKTLKYFPDFQLDGKIVEIKGYKTYVDALKINSVNQPIELLYKNDLKNVFTYVETKTGLKIKNLYQLYE